MGHIIQWVLKPVLFFYLSSLKYEQNKKQFLLLPKIKTGIGKKKKKLFKFKIFYIFIGFKF